MKTLKQLVMMISEIESYDDAYRIFHEIDLSFDKEKISFKDHEMLWRIVNNLKVVDGYLQNS